jgi:tetratricopeptide (TPR) repeat protein
MVRFGRWKDILEVQLPRNKDVMIFRTATIAFSRGLAYANMGDIAKAKKCADQYDSIRNNPIAEHRILHNNVVKNLLDVDAPMLRGEIAYHEGRYDDAFRMLRKAVELQDGLNYDEPWGKMQPIRHALGGLLLERNHLAEAADVFRTDLRFHPRNPFALVGLIQCLQRQVSHGLLEENDREMCSTERQELIHILEAQRRSEWADFDVHASCACCVVSTQSCS